MLVAQERVAVGDHEVGPAEDTHEVGRSDDLELVGGGRRGSETARVTERLTLSRQTGRHGRGVNISRSRRKIINSTRPDI